MRATAGPDPDPQYVTHSGSESGKLVPMRGRVSVVTTNFTAFWLVLAIVAFVLHHWAAGAICLALTAAGGAGLAYRWPHPLGS